MFDFNVNLVIATDSEGLRCFFAVISASSYWIVNESSALLYFSWENNIFSYYNHRNAEC